MLGWSPEVALTTPMADIELALQARYRFQRQQFRGLAGLLGVKVEDERPADKAGAARKLKGLLTQLAEK